MEAISHAGTSMGLQCSDGILLAAEKKVFSKLVDPRQPFEKIFTISQDILCVVSGITADANTLIDHARLTCERYRYAYHEAIPVEQLVQTLCNLKQSYTQNGGMRPFGCSFLIAGWDKHYGYQIYQTDPSGNYSGWKATCIGANSGTAQGIFKSDYPDEGLAIGQGKTLLFKALAKTCENNTLSGDKLEFALIQRNDDGRTVFTCLTGENADTFIKEVQQAMPVESK